MQKFWAWNKRSLFLVGKAYLRKADACNYNKNNKYLNSTLFKLFEIKNLSEDIFALNPVSKNHSHCR